MPLFRRKEITTGDKIFRNQAQSLQDNNDLRIRSCAKQIAKLLLTSLLFAAITLHNKKPIYKQLSASSSKSDDKTHSSLTSDNFHNNSSFQVPKEGPVVVQREEETNYLCDQNLMDNQEAIKANISTAYNDIKYHILLHPTSVDRYITPKILKTGTYEPEMDAFIASVLPITNLTKHHPMYAVDIGANIGAHTLHMLHRGANVLSFEPAPDTAALLKCSAKIQPHHNNIRTIGNFTLIQAGASDIPSMGSLYRHKDSPGMTTFGGANSSFALENINGDQGGETLQLVRAQDVLSEHGLPENDPTSLRLLKVDAEGYEWKALQGLNLTRFPFQHLTFEFFPKMLRESGGIDPVNLLVLVRESGYKCNIDEKAGKTREEMNAWARSIKTHINIYCELNNHA